MGTLKKPSGMSNLLTLQCDIINYKVHFQELHNRVTEKLQNISVDFYVGPHVAQATQV